MKGVCFELSTAVFAILEEPPCPFGYTTTFVLTFIILREFSSLMHIEMYGR